MKKLIKDTKSVGMLGLGIGVGSAISARVGYGQGAFAAMGGMMPIVSTTVMGTNVLRLNKKNLKVK